MLEKEFENYKAIVEKAFDTCGGDNYKLLEYINSLSLEEQNAIKNATKKLINSKTIQKYDGYYGDLVLKAARLSSVYVHRSQK